MTPTIANHVRVGNRGGPRERGSVCRDRPGGCDRDGPRLCRMLWLHSITRPNPQILPFRLVLDDRQI